MGVWVVVAVGTDTAADGGTEGAGAGSTLESGVGAGALSWACAGTARINDIVAAVAERVEPMRLRLVMCAECSESDEGEEGG